MKRTLRALVLSIASLAAPLVACGGPAATPADAAVGAATTDGASPWVANFAPGPQPPNTTRFVTATVTGIAPGADVEYCQWIAAASPEAQDVLAFSGAQSPGGHHTVIYATSETGFPVGESHVCTEGDMLTISFIGAIGGEGNGGSAATLPDGLFFRLPANQALIANTHWLNASPSTVDGQAVIDIQFAPASSSRTTADIFANNADSFAIAPQGMTSWDVNCTLGADLNFAMVANHMHTHGRSAYTELIHTDGTKTPLAVDDTWASDQQFNAKYTRYSVAAPLAAHKGEVIHTHCEWMNTSSNPILFPAEMCAGTGFYFPGQGQIVCNDGDWQP